jgi:hypothetical protein
MPAPIEEMINGETRRKLNALRSHLEARGDKKKKAPRKVKRLNKDGLRYPPSVMSDKDYARWKKTNREMSRLYDR